jgi:quinol monooxygenase YgiN
VIFVAGTMYLNTAVLEDFERDVAAMLGKVKGEKGCLHYSLLVEDASSGLVNVLEQWEDDEALVTHLAQPWIVTFFNRYSGHMRSHTLKIYDIAGSRPLPGM